MKILVLADRLRHTRAGWVAARRVSSALRSAGHDVRVLALEGSAEGPDVPVRIVSAERMPREVAKARADVVVSTSTEMLVLMVAHARSGTRLVHWERARGLVRDRGEQALQLLGSQLDLVVVPDDALAGSLQDLLGGTGVPVRCIPDPVAAGTLPVAEGDSRVIAAAGNLAIDSGFGLLIHSFALAAEQLPDWRLRIHGRGFQRPNLAATVRATGLFDRVELPGLSREMPLDWARASIAVAPAATGLPLTVTEAMAAGLPVVAADTFDGARQRIEHGVTGLLVPPGSREELAEALVALAHDPVRRRELGTAARAAVAAFTPVEVARQWEDALSASSGHAPRMPRAGADQTDETNVPVTAEARPGDLESASRRLLSGLFGIARSLAPESFVLRPVGDRPAVVVVPAARRGEFLRQLPDLGAHLRAAEPVVEGPQCLLSDALPSLLRSNAPVVTISDGGFAEIDVEFWRESEGALRSTRDNEWIDHVTLGSPREEIDVFGLGVPTVPVATGPTVHDRTFPIDVVYTWVDGADPAWQARRDAALAQKSGISLSRAASGKARYQSRDELRYSMRSLHMFAPWVRRIFLVTDDQVPGWLDTSHPQVTVVSHRDILDAEHLPVFNSHAIETGLHRIDGLSEHFIYFNDDVLLGRQVRPEHFFTFAGQFHAFVGAQTISVDEESALPYQRAGLNNRALLRERFGLTTTRVMRHTPHPMRRSVLESLEREWPEELRRTAAAPFRSESDLSVASSLAQYYGIATGNAVPAELNALFVSLVQPNVLTVFKQLLARRDRDSICLADHHVWAWPENVVTRQLLAFLEQYYPVVPGWEKQG